MDDDEDALREALRDTKPLRRARRVAPRRPPPPPHPVQRLRDERAVMVEALAASISIDDALDSGEEPNYLREGLARQVLRQLRRGHWVVQAEIDLHGLNRIEALDAVAEFLAGCAARGRRCVRIVHGKGLGSKNREPVLKHLLVKHLPRRDAVLAFCQAPAAQGGGGALLVLLKARK
ncbi:MAG: Smr/MutS family protein [Proteobacteria bacterium]|nr:Smr/MutS family protein [Pseudomonadota bacterium]